MRRDRSRLDTALRGWKLPDPAAEGDKELRGLALVVAGSRPMPGAVVLAATAALRSGAGKLQIVTVASVAAAVGVAVPEAYVDGVRETADGGFHPDTDVDAARADAILLGPGMREDEALGRSVVRWLARLRADQVAVLDAAALTALAPHRDEVRGMPCRRVITPHRGEMATLLGIDKDEVEADPDGIVLRAARELGAIAVLKGAETLVSDGESTWVNDAGNVGLAISGSGDVLAGLLAGLCARGAPPLHAAGWAVHVHARAGEVLARSVGPLGYLPREILGEIPRLLG